MLVLELVSLWLFGVFLCDVILFTAASDILLLCFFFFFFFFFFNDPAPTEIYTLSLHDALPIYPVLMAKSLAL